jgi:quinol-cytochrome oxidoreductase complex cytochrome b subunit
VLLGVGVLAWNAYNLLIERQPVFGWASIEAVSAMVVTFMTFGVYLIRLSLWNPKSGQPQKTDPAKPIVPR